MNTRTMKIINVLMLSTLLVLTCASSSISDSVEDNNIPEWVKRIDFGFSAGSNQHPRFYFETVQPLYQDDDDQNTVFFQPRISYLKHNGAANLGVGYRKLLDDNSILLGTNLFFDYQQNNKHYRTGVGAEAFINQIELRANSYFGLSPARVNQVNGSQTEYEKAVDGADFEAGLPVPYMNWIKLYAGGYWYDYKKFDDKTGWKSRTEIKPFDFLTINFITYDDNKGGQEYTAEARMSLYFGGDSEEKTKSNIGISDQAYTEKADHSNRVLDRVERQYEIEVERYIETVSGTIEIKRGT